MGKHYRHSIHTQRATFFLQGFAFCGKRRRVACTCLSNFVRVEQPLPKNFTKGLGKLLCSNMHNCINIGENCTQEAQSGEESIVRRRVCAQACVFVFVCVCVCARARACARHGHKRRWRDVAASDLRATGIPEAQWYHLAQDRRDWRERSRRKLPSQPQPIVFVCVCGHDFRHPNDLSRHKNYCLA